MQSFAKACVASRNIKIFHILLLRIDVAYTDPVHCPSVRLHPARLSFVRQAPAAVHALSQSGSEALDVRKLADFMAMQSSEDDADEGERFAMERIATVLNESVGTVKNMAFKKKGLLSLQPDEIKSRIETIAQVIDVDYERARRMVVIQPGLLFDTEKQAQVLQYGIKSICYELNAPKDEIVDLIINNQSVLHGRQLHLSVADIAHLALLRQPKGRIVD